jgi:hypothetical protein
MTRVCFLSINMDITELFIEFLERDMGVAC